MKQKYNVKVIYDQCKVGDNTILQNYNGLMYYQIKPDYEYTITMKDDDHSIDDIERKIDEYEKKYINPVYDFSKYPVNLMTAFVYNDKNHFDFAYQVQHHKAYSAHVSTYYKDRIEDKMQNDVWHTDTYFHPEDNEHYTIQRIAKLDEDIKRDKKKIFLEHLRITMLALRSCLTKDQKLESELETSVNISNILGEQFGYNLNERSRLQILSKNMNK